MQEIVEQSSFKYYRRVRSEFRLHSTSGGGRIGSSFHCIQLQSRLHIRSSQECQHYIKEIQLELDQFDIDEAQFRHAFQLERRTHDLIRASPYWQRWHQPLLQHPCQYYPHEQCNEAASTRTHKRCFSEAVSRLFNLQQHTRESAWTCCAWWVDVLGSGAE